MLIVYIATYFFKFLSRIGNQNFEPFVIIIYSLVYDFSLFLKLLLLAAVILLKNSSLCGNHYFHRILSTFFIGIYEIKIA